MSKKKIWGLLVITGGLGLLVGAVFGWLVSTIKAL